MKCPVCKSSKIKKLFLKKKFPYFTSPLNTTKLVKLDRILKNKKKTQDLKVVYCDSCSHTFLKNIPDTKTLNELYNKFYNYPSPLKKGFEPTRDNKFLKIFNEQKKMFKIKSTVLEVGCFDGYILSKIKSSFNVFGCDPSPGAVIGRKQGLNIERNFFNKGTFGKKTFDIIIARHIIEHIFNLDDFLKNLTSKLTKKGKLILEMPNISFFLKSGLPSVFSLQHIQYFNHSSIEKLLASNGFKILKLKYTDDNLIIFSQKSERKIKAKYKKNLSFHKTFKNKQKLIERKVRTYFAKNSIKKNDIVIWGAGGFGVGFLKFFNINLNLIKHFVDTDRKKNNCNYYGIKTKILSPISKNINCAKILIITSMYSNEILKDILKRKINIKIITLFPKLKFYNIKIN